MPTGYTTYKSYKPWLRDEFLFRCVYCLVRERWCHNGHENFGVDHLKPKSVAPELACQYPNLLYVCNSCNCRKGDAWPIPDPIRSPYGLHIETCGNGSVKPLTDDGKYLIRLLQLNRDELVNYRLRVCKLIQKLDEQLRASWLGIPDDAPNLAALRPPGNAKDQSAVNCWFMTRQTNPSFIY